MCRDFSLADSLAARSAKQADETVHSMAMRVAINGFDRISRLVRHARRNFTGTKFVAVAMNDPCPDEAYIAIRARPGRRSGHARAAAMPFQFTSVMMDGDLHNPTFDTQKEEPPATKGPP